MQLIVVVDVVTWIHFVINLFWRKNVVCLSLIYPSVPNRKESGYRTNERHYKKSLTFHPLSFLTPTFCHVLRFEINVLDRQFYFVRQKNSSFIFVVNMANFETLVFGQTKVDYGSLVLGSNQFLVLCQLPQKWHSLQKWSKRLKNINLALLV